MDIKKLQKLVIDALEDVKAQDVQLYDTTHLTSMFDRIAIASGTSNRQTKALAASVRDKVKAAGGQILSMEGETTGEWVLVDLGDIVVHIMQPTIRAYYRLEEIWGDKPVKIAAPKRATTTKLAKASTDKTADAAPKKRAPRKTVATSESKPAVAKKPAAKKAAPVKKPVAKTTAASSTAAKTTAKRTTTKKPKADA